MICRTTAGLFATALLLLAGGAPAEDGDGDGRGSAAQGIPGPTWFAQAFARGPGGLNVTSFWAKGSSMRAETIYAGHRVVTIVHGDTYYAYDRMLQTGVAIQRAPAALAVDDPNHRPFGNEAVSLARGGGEKVREEEILGRKCDVLRVTDQRGKREVWVTQDAARVPIRIEIYHRSSGTKQSVEYINWQTGLPVPDGFFEPEPHIRFKRFGFEEYMRKSTLEGPQGPVPVLYGDLLQGPRERTSWLEPTS